VRVRSDLLAVLVLGVGLGVAGPRPSCAQEGRAPPAAWAPGQEAIPIPPVYCETCIREKRVADKIRPIRLMERDGRDVLAFIQKPEVHYLEWDHLKFVSQIPAVNLGLEMLPKTEEEKRNWLFLKREIEDLQPLFPGLRVGTLNPHQMAHLMMNRLIRYYKQFETEMEFLKAVEGLVLADYGMGPHLGMKGPFEIYVLKGKQNYLKWEDRFLGRQSIVGQKWHLFEDRVLVFSSYYYGDVKLFNNFLHHNVAHLLLWGYRGWTFKLPGWIHVGYAHYVERSIHPRYNTCCFDEGGEPDTVKGWRWDTKVRQAVAAADVPPLAELKLKVEMAEFVGSDHLICWSLVRFLIEQDRKKWRDFVDAISQPGRMDQDEALRKTYGWTFNLLEEHWREHVLRTYPKP